MMSNRCLNPPPEHDFVYMAKSILIGGRIKKVKIKKLIKFV